MMSGTFVRSMSTSPESILDLKVMEGIIMHDEHALLLVGLLMITETEELVGASAEATLA